MKRKIMLLFIDTTIKDKIKLELWKKKKCLGKKIIKTKRSQAEKLLLGVEKILVSHNLQISDIKKIKANNYGGTFTSLRVGVATANAISYALNIPVCSVKDLDLSPRKENNKKFRPIQPFYNGKPNISQILKV